MRNRFAARWYVAPVVAVLISAALAPYSSAQTAPRGKPNVILIMTDDQGYGDMSCHGNPFIKTPNIDALYRQSVRLTNFHVDPTCSPTRAALMSGQYSTRVGVWLTYMGRHRLRSDVPTMGNVFQDNGYRTAVFGKWHLGDNYPYRPQDRGFDQSLIHGGGVVGEAPDHWGNDYYDDVYFRNHRPERVSGYCTDVWFDEAIRTVEQHAKNRSQPFFLYLPTNAPHGPCNVPEEYWRPYDGVEGIPAARARFYGCIASIDENIGRLRSRLEELGLAQNTLLVFMTDNGTAGGVTLKGAAAKGNARHGWTASGFNAGMRGKKGGAYEGGHRAACFLHWPAGNLGSPRDIPQLSAHFDLIPTLIDLCRLDPPAGARWDGTSLAGLLDPKSDRDWPPRTLFVHHQGRFGQKITDDRPIKNKDFAVMTDQWRLVGDELYDIKNDPSQRTDLATAHPAVVKQLKSRYEQWWTGLSPSFDRYNRTIIGSDQQPDALLTCQQWHGDDVPYSQQHVRAGMQANGFWDLTVAKSGDYRVTVRRWPRELDLAMDAKFPKPDLDPQRIDAQSKLNSLASRAIAVKSVRLSVGDFDQTRSVDAGTKEVVFDVGLTAGDTNLQTWLVDDKGDAWGAYYVYIEPVSGNG